MGSRLLPLSAAFLSLALISAHISPSSQAIAQEGPPVYLALGDSLAVGVGASDPSTMGYVARAYASLRTSERFGESGLELVNLGVAGATSTDLVQSGGQLDSAIEEIRSRRENDSATDDVEIITIDIGGNDLLSLVTPGSPCLE